jgi:hypothetical protein
LRNRQSLLHDIRRLNKLRNHSNENMKLDMTMTSIRIS